MTKQSRFFPIFYFKIQFFRLKFSILGLETGTSLKKFLKDWTKDRLNEKMVLVPIPGKKHKKYYDMKHPLLVFNLYVAIVSIYLTFQAKNI